MLFLFGGVSSSSWCTCKRNWYQFFTPPKKNTGHRCDKYLPILYTSEIIKEFFTCVRNWYQFFTPEKKSHQFFTGVTNTYKFFTRQKLSTWEIWAQILDLKIYRNWPYVNFTFGKCDVLIPILLMGVKFTKWEIYGSTRLRPSPGRQHSFVEIW